MTQIDIISGFLGAGKTTLIKKLLAEAYRGEKIVLIENEFGDISIDGGFLKDAGIEISEMSAGCICCSLVGDFGRALKEVRERFAPDRILIEPSGVGKLSDVCRAVEETAAGVPGMRLHSAVTVADATKVRTYMKNFGEFYNDQIEAAGSIILSRTQKLTEEKLQGAVRALREKNAAAAILTTPWDQLEGEALLAAIQRESLSQTLLDSLTPEDDRRRLGSAPDCAACQMHLDGQCGGRDGGCADYVRESHHHCDDPNCDCHHHGHDHHCDDPDCGCHHHGHDHHCDDPDCGCHHHGHGHHHAGEVFSSWGGETPRRFDPQALRDALEELDSGEYGDVLRAKGIVESSQGGWLEFDYVPGEHDLRPGRADYTGRLCVIGAGLQPEKLAALFGL